MEIENFLLAIFDEIPCTIVHCLISYYYYYYYCSVWREWVVDGDRFVGMRFALGEKCGKTDREAKVKI